MYNSKQNICVEMSGHEGLAAAIILQAVKDYRKALKNGEYEQKRECERFFHSQWFGILSDIDCKSLIDRLRKEVIPNDG